MLNQREELLCGLKWSGDRIKCAMDRLRRVFRMLDCLVPCITIRDAKDKEVVEIFKRLNRGGTGLKQGDVEAANLGIGSSVVVLQQMREFVAGHLCGGLVLTSLSPFERSLCFIEIMRPMRKCHRIGRRMCPPSTREPL